MAIAKHIIPGEKFNRLTVLSEAPKRPGNPHRRVMAQCECGVIRDYEMSTIRTGHAKSCGCYQREQNEPHGHAKAMSPTYKSWVSMKRRCDPKYGKPEYVGKGIAVCVEWSESFETFLVDMGERPKGMTLDRRDNKKGYSKDNCRWATNSQQANNRSTSHYVTAHGKTLTIMEWSELTGIPFQTIRHRLLRGWGDERAVTERSKRPRIIALQDMLDLQEAA